METRGRARGAGRGKDGSPSAAHIPPDGGDGMLRWRSLAAGRWKLRAAKRLALKPLPRAPSIEPMQRIQRPAPPKTGPCLLPPGSLLPLWCPRETATEALWGPMEPLKGPPVAGRYGLGAPTPLGWLAVARGH
ncbi:hypothetical protein CCMA1212_006693 [Trichoderma ghanense]|uniref:Uncharacterized protein n=1 Tax=Trichoderma ghanense TaxID=65468 RepID=A0ABY2H0S4_9HYPO